jgi:hypothetical protein
MGKRGVVIFTFLLSATLLIGASASVGAATPNHKAVVSGVVTVVTSDGPNGGATYRLPKVRGLSPKSLGPTITARIQTEILRGQSLQAVVAEYNRTGFGITSTDFRVGYNNNGVLNLVSTTETMAAYPSGYTNSHVYDLRSGVQVTADAEFSRTGYALLRHELQQQLDVVLSELVDDPDISDDDPSEVRELVRSSGSGTVSEITMNEFQLTPLGLVFQHSFAFPHAALAIEPDGQLFVSWKRLSPWFSIDSVLQRALPKR